MLTKEELREVINSIGPNGIIENINQYDHIDLFLVLIEEERYDLLNKNVFNFDFNDESKTLLLINTIISDEDISYFLKNNGFSFKDSELQIIRRLYFKNFKFEQSDIGRFIVAFFSSKTELNDYIKDNRSFFVEYAKKSNDFYALNDCPEFISILIKVGKIYSLHSFNYFDASSFKALIGYINDGNKIKEHYPSDRMFCKLFEYKNDISKEDFCKLLNIFQDEDRYLFAKNRDGERVVSCVIKDNIEFLIECVSLKNEVPKCLVESEYFRDECIKKNRFDLVVQCLVPENLIDNEDLCNKYAIALGTETDALKLRLKWLEKYYDKNNNIYNTIVAKMLSDNNFNVPMEHYERFINDISFEMMICDISENGKLLFKRMLEIVDNKKYDASFMLYRVVDNINNYKELVDNINVDDLSLADIKTLLVIFQDGDNNYDINSVDDLHNLKAIKKSKLKSIDKTNIDCLKDALVRFLFNMDINEAERLNKLYCYVKEESILELLNESELPKHVFKLLCILNNIVESKDIDNLKELYDNSLNEEIYNSYLPLDVYLRMEYAKLYTSEIDSTDVLNEGNEVALGLESYYDKQVKVCVPYGDINMMVHCLGSCSLSEDIIDRNYAIDWIERPQIKDHIVASSYLNQENLNKMRSSGSVTFAFKNIDGGALYGMGPTDIDSIGPSKRYNASYFIMKGNGPRVAILPPSLMVKFTTDGYNEFLIERRNNYGNLETDFKRVPDYIIMSVDTVQNEDNFKVFSELIKSEFSFLHEEDINSIVEYNSAYKTKEILSKYMADLYNSLDNPEIQKEELLVRKTKQLMSALLYEQSIKAASEFNIPLIVIDKLHYFKRLLASKDVYDNKMKEELLNLYNSLNDYMKNDLWTAVRFETDYNVIMQKCARRK